MFKNKYVLWSSVGVALALVIGGACWFVLGRDTSSQRASLSQASTAEPIPGTGTKEVTLSQPAQSNGPQLSANPTPGSTLNSGSSAPTTSNSDELAKLLDPTTFSQYDKYKTAQSASYVDLQKGTGAAVTGGSQVAVVYRGWLTNGALFDESKAGSDGKLQAFGFTSGQHQVIPGWESGLEGAKEGGVRLLVIPPALGYGATGQGPIPGNAVLVFQVQIVQVK